MNCTQCGQTVPDDARFCGKCGRAIESAAPGAQPTSSGSQSTPPGAQPSSRGALRDFGLATASAGTGSGSTGTAPFPGASALPGLIERAKNIILTPRSEWPVIEAEPTSVLQLYTGYVMPMAAFAAVMSFLRMSVVGVSLPFGGTIRTPLLSGLISSVVTFALGLIGLYLVGFIINMFAPTFSGQRDQRQALKTAAYALTPAWLATALTFLPLGSLLQLIACVYGIYVLYVGLPVMMRSAQDKAAGYTAAIVVCSIVIGILFAMVGATLGGVGRGAMLGALQQPVQRHDQFEFARPHQDARPDQGAQSDQAASSDPARAAEQAGAAVGSLVGALSSGLGGNVHHEPVDFNTLKGMLPASLPQMQRTDAQGSNQQALGVKSSSATASYEGASSGANARIRIKISDIAGVSGLLDAASGLMPTGETQTETGFEKDMVVNGRMIHEKYDRQSRDGEITVIVAKRFSVEVSGQGVDIGLLEGALNGVDLAQLESMKDSGAQSH